MQIIELDATTWATIDDFYDALFQALGAPKWHGRNLNALDETMVWDSEINALKPPYLIRILGVDALPAQVRDYIEHACACIAEARARRLADGEPDVEVGFDLGALN